MALETWASDGADVAPGGDVAGEEWAPEGGLDAADFPPGAEELLELRVLSGLQSGAALPLEDVLTVGSGEEADLLLLDDGIAPAQLRVSHAPQRGVVLEALDEEVGLADGASLPAGEAVALPAGEPFQAGTVWLMVCSSSEPWSAWTPPVPVATDNEPEPVPASDARALEPAPVISAPVLLAAEMSDRGPRPEAAPGEARAKRSMRSLGTVIVAAGLLSTVLGVAALVRQALDADPDADAEVAVPDADKTGVRPAPVTGKGNAAPVGRPAAAAGAGASGNGGVVSGGAPAQAPVALAPAPATLATVDRPPSGGLVVRLPGGDTVALPFDVQEVLLGTQSHVILTDGRRLEPGDHAGVWRLVEIRPGALVFDGPRTVQIGW